MHTRFYRFFGTPPPTAQAWDNLLKGQNTISKFNNTVQEAIWAKHGQESYIVGNERQGYRRQGAS
jgi:hypothetical protein